MEPRVIVLLAFVFITVLTALAVLGAAIGLFPSASESLITWGIPVVLGEIVVSVVLFFRTQWVQRIKVNLDFDGAEPDSFDPLACTYAIMDSTGKEIEKDAIAPILGHGGWQVQLPKDVRPEHSVSLSLKTQNGEEWAIRPFRPDVQTQKPIRVS
jgi:hypothetical protein